MKEFEIDHISDGERLASILTFELARHKILHVCKVGSNILGDELRRSNRYDRHSHTQARSE